MKFERYSPPIKSIWQGRVDGPNPTRIHEIVQCVNLRDESLQKHDVPVYGIIGFACDAGIKRNYGRSGAVLGPIALRKAFATFPRPLNGKSLLLDLGDITCEDGDLEKSQQQLAIVVHELLLHKIHPIIIGGGHEVALGHFQGISNAHPTLDCAIINFDAHYDLRPLVDNQIGSSGTSFLQIANERKKVGLSFDYTCIGVQSQSVTSDLSHQAKELNVKTVSAEEIHLQGIDSSLELLEELIHKHDGLYVTICMDVFAAPFAPGVSSPQPLGLFPMQVIPLLNRLAASGKVIGFDIAELSPPFDFDDCTAKLAASLVLSYINEKDKAKR